MNETAIVTGAGSGIGKAAAEMLQKEGYEVYGIARHFMENVSFHPVVLDLLNTGKLLAFLDRFEKDNLKVVINNAGTAWYGLHEEMNAEKIQRMVRTNLEVPMIIASQLMRTLRVNQGWLINIASVTAQYSSPHAAAYGASKAGLLHFSRTLYEENRKYGVKVTCLLPDLTETNLYRNADFNVSGKREETLYPEDVADAVQYVLHLPEGVTMPEMVIRPQKNRIIRRRT